jgi:hypothetical protein
MYDFKVTYAECSLILGKWMRSEIMGSSGERPTVKEAVGGPKGLSCNSDFSFYIYSLTLKGVQIF